MKCKFCNTEIENITFDLGNTAPSNSLIFPDNLFSSEVAYPLTLYTCPKCFLVQIEEQVNGEEIFNENYVYFSSASKYWLAHAKKYCKEITNKLSLNNNSFVVEIASNDGYLLQNFVNSNIKCLGIEPTQNTANEAMLKGVPTLVNFFTESLAEQFAQDNERADLIIANNVLAHVPDINDFVSGFKKLLKEEGTITVEFPHLFELVKHNEFDTIYHEHYFYFSLYTLNIIFNKHDLSIYDVEELETHGGSLRIYITHKGNIIDSNSIKNNVKRILNKELKSNVNTLDFYSSIQSNAFKIKLEALNYLVKQKINNKKIIAFGAAAKGNTFLNYSGIKKDIIDFVVDETPYKIGKYMPQSKIPILSFDKIMTEKPDIIIILPWNHKKEIVEKLEFTKEWGAKIVTFIPKLEVS
jgi:ubiquinone/menaquinone biosynthesis C-methylase UbiE